jgi:NAD(P)H-hydrate epimerase
LDTVISEAKVPVIIDADGLNLLSKRLDQMNLDSNSRWSFLSGLLKENTILTPHLMELSRLTALPVSDITDNIIDTAIQYSYNSNLIVAIKDARTVVTNSGRKYINVSGNNGMATGGSGDVLTGIIAALTAQGMAPFDAACLAVYVHGLAGDIASEQKSNYSMMAGDIVDSIEKVIKRKSEEWKKK